MTCKCAVSKAFSNDLETRNNKTCCWSWSLVPIRTRVKGERSHSIIPVRWLVWCKCSELNPTEEMTLSAAPSAPSGVWPDDLFSFSNSAVAKVHLYEGCESCSKEHSSSDLHVPSQMLVIFPYLEVWLPSRYTELQDNCYKERIGFWEPQITSNDEKPQERKIHVHTKTYPRMFLANCGITCL